MNKTAINYKWEIIGSGNPIYSNTDTISNFYPYTYSNFWYVGLRTTDATGCKDTLYQTILVQNITQTITGFKEYGMDKLLISVYPNPAQNIVTISSAVDLEKITLLNALGQEVLVLNKPEQKQEIGISHLPAGIYFIKAENRQGLGLFKVVKE